MVNSFLGAALWFNLDVMGSDRNGNTKQTEAKLNGILGQAADIAAAIITVIADTAAAVADAVMDAINWIIDWIEDFVNSIFENVIKPMLETFHSFI